MDMLACFMFSLFLSQVTAKAVVDRIHKRSDVCYSDLGCFNTDTPFWSLQRPINFLPQRPEKIHTRFYLYTRDNPTTLHSLNANAFDTIKGSTFSASKPTKIISHGFLENGRVPWMVKMKDALLKHGDYNVINVDWGGGSQFPYTQATANTRLVGAEIAKLIKVLQTLLNANPLTFHIIGHSLGAHIAGYAGERIPNLGRITGMDPAGPYFENTDKTVRLDPTDALFVDTIHTDGETLLPNLGFGLQQSLGHVDYYPNGGKDQPGCTRDPLSNIQLQGGLYDGAKMVVACNHLRSYDYFTESINTVCPFSGYKCDTYDNFKSGNCLPCVGNKCGRMGFNADKVKPPPGTTGYKYYLMTAPTAPYCRYHYLIQIELGNPIGSHTWRGKIMANIHGSNGQLGERVLDKDFRYYEPGKTYKYVVTAPHDIGSITDATLKWDHSANLLNPLQWNVGNFRNPKLYFKRFFISVGETNQQFIWNKISLSTTRLLQATSVTSEV